VKAAEELQRTEPAAVKGSVNDKLVGWYKENMAAMRSLIM
jgi:hypothetical protein